MRAEYIDHMGDDLRVVNAARVSFNKQRHPDDRNPDDSLREEDVKLIKYLAKHGHWTPFAHPQITMRETIPIFVARQRFKHMVGFIYNEVSRRYVDDTPEFFEPDAWRGRPEGGMKQGSGEGLGEEGEMFALDLYTDIIRSAANDYKLLLENGVAPEQARMVLPQSMYTSYYVTGSLAAWARAYKQRIDPHAQKEIQDLAKQWGNILQPLYPVSWDALTQGDYA